MAALAIKIMLLLFVVYDNKKGIIEKIKLIINIIRV